MLIASTYETESNCPPPPSAAHLISSFSYSKLILLFFRCAAVLHFSAFYGHLEISRLLLQCNADVEAKASVE
jgi:hypothetical protein